MVPSLPVSVCTFRSKMAFFWLWLLDVIEDFRQVEELFEPATLDYVITVGRREPMAFALYFMFLVDRVHRRSALFNQANYIGIWYAIYAMRRAALAAGSLPPPPPPSSPSSSSSPPSPRPWPLSPSYSPQPPQSP